ncbi:hypothetical protein H1C71_041881 [Ictidomys tridecemlineatus]|nr:hypothetical protein H1C71_041881 [Ictidomys tridecemlineatus]
MPFLSRVLGAGEQVGGAHQMNGASLASALASAAGHTECKGPGWGPSLWAGTSQLKVASSGKICFSALPCSFPPPPGHRPALAGHQVGVLSDLSNTRLRGGPKADRPSHPELLPHSRRADRLRLPEKPAPTQQTSAATRGRQGPHRAPRAQPGLLLLFCGLLLQK